MAFQTNFKESPTKRRIEKHQARQAVKSHEEREKRKVRARDKHCRFPLCGCKRFGLPLHVSHDLHKGRLGAKESVERSIEAKMVYLCSARHMDNIISRHKGTMRAVPLTDDGYNGPVAWEIDATVFSDRTGVRIGLAVDDGDTMWYRVASEVETGRLEPLSVKQRTVLLWLAEMDL